MRAKIAHCVAIMAVIGLAFCGRNEEIRCTGAWIESTPEQLGALEIQES